VLSAAGAPPKGKDDWDLEARPEALREEHALVEASGSTPRRRRRYRNEHRLGWEPRGDPVCEQVGQHVTRIATPSLVGEDRTPQRSGIAACRANAQRRHRQTVARVDPRPASRTERRACNAATATGRRKKSSENRR
jgi:hypothetical protein